MIENPDYMFKESLRMVGFSVLGGNAGLQGPYELVLDEIWATNDPTSKVSLCSMSLDAMPIIFSDQNRRTG